MRIGKDLIDKPIYSMADGKHLGDVKDLYLDPSLDGIMGIFLGKESLFSRKERLIKRETVHVFGLDAILVKNANVVLDSSQYAPVAGWLRREDLQNRDVDTPGGTKVGKIGDVIVDENARIIGFSLSRVMVEGPIAENRTVARAAMIDAGNEDGVMTIDIRRAEVAAMSQEQEDEVGSETEQEA